MIVFHSSPCIVNHPDVSFSRDYLDFGKGFYVTTIEEQARKYARRFLLRGMNAYLNKYELSDDLRNYNARYFDSYDDSWLDFVALCRAGRDKSDYDIVTGGIANDKVFRTIDLFFSGDDPMFNPGAEKTAEDDPSAGLLPGGFYFGVSEVLSASNHPTALKPGWAKGCNISPDDARRLSDKLLGRLGMTDFELVSSQVVEPLTERGNRAKRGRYEYKYVQVADGIPLSSGEPDSTGCTVAIDDRGVVDARLTRLELGESKIVNSKVMTLDGVLAVLQKKLAAAGLVKDSIVKEISFEYMSVEDPETYNSTVFPCWRFCIATTATLEQYGEYENDIIINAVTGEFYAVTNRYE